MWEVTVDKEKCTGDEECVEVCPVDVFEMVDGKAWRFARLRQSRLKRCSDHRKVILECLDRITTTDFQ
jgi:Fe-S-cluster-containing hydrogenase component 2